MSKPAAPTGPPGYAVATGVPGRVVFHNCPPNVVEALHRLAQHYGIPQRQLHLSAPTITD